MASKNEEIVVIDDMFVIAEMVKEHLEIKGFTNVKTYADSTVAVSEILSRKDSPIIITDFRMPQKSGKEVIDEVKNQYPAVRAVIMTSTESESAIREIPYRVFKKDEKEFFEKLLTWIMEC
jgi:DNA-binding NtrC family response regulator